MTRKLRVRTPLSTRRPAPASRAVAADQPAEYSTGARLLRILHAAAVIAGVIAIVALVVGLVVTP